MNGPDRAVPMLVEAVGLVGRAIVGLRAAGEVEWEARAADLYRASVAEALHAVAGDRALLDETVRRASSGWAR